MGASVGFRFRTQWAFPALVGAPPLSPIEFAQAQSPGKNPAEGALRDLIVFTWPRHVFIVRLFFPPLGFGFNCCFGSDCCSCQGAS